MSARRTLALVPGLGTSVTFDLFVLLRFVHWKCHWGYGNVL